MASIFCGTSPYQDTKQKQTNARYKADAAARKFARGFQLKQLDRRRRKIEASAGLRKAQLLPARAQIPEKKGDGIFCRFCLPDAPLAIVGLLGATPLPRTPLHRLKLFLSATGKENIRDICGVLLFLFFSSSSALRTYSTVAIHRRKRTSDSSTHLSLADN
jgi:hypothetical protein